MDFIRLKITKIIPETPDTKSFYLQAVDDAALPYEAGQFITLVLLHHDEEIRRSYSLGSSPGAGNEVFITVKRRANGAVSRLLLDHYQVGDVLQVIPPSGRFVLEKETTIRHYFFFTAGSGIVPVFGLLHEILGQRPEVRITLVNQSRNEENIIFRQRLLQLASDHPHLEYIQFLSAPIDHAQPVRRLNNAITEKIVSERIGNAADRLPFRFYICGPVPFMRAVQFTLRLMGYGDEQIFTEKFVIQEQKSPVPLLTDTTDKKVTTLFKHKTETFTVQYPETILHAAQRQKIVLPYSCNAGQCSTCAVICTHGKIVLAHNDILTDKDLQKGLVLTCTGHPVTDIVLDYTITQK